MMTGMTSIVLRSVWSWDWRDRNVDRRRPHMGMAKEKSIVVQYDCYSLNALKQGSEKVESAI